tara:strand:- start:75 stop:1067 length:993 start_codon:yes stop_codon:yes gene_type:complete
MSSNLLKLEACKSYASEIKDRCSTYETWNIKDVLGLKPLQVRDQEDVDHIKEIQNGILRDNKSIENTDPVIIINYKGKKIILDGNHTIEALRRLGVPEIKVLYISQDEVNEKGFSKYEWIEVGLFLNENHKKVYKNNTDSTFEKHVLRLLLDGYDKEYCVKYLKTHGKYRTKTIIKKATEDFHNNKLEKLGKKVKRYGRGGIPEHQKELNDKVQELRAKNAVVITGSTGSDNRIIVNLVHELNDAKNDKIWKYEFLLYNDNNVNEENWKIIKTKFSKTIERLLSKMKDVEIITEDGGKVYYPYQFNITVMEHLMDDGSENLEDDGSENIE